MTRDKDFSNIKVELTIQNSIADQLIDQARSFRHQCSKAVKDMQDVHIEKMKKKKGLKDIDNDIDDDSEEAERRIAHYISIRRNHSLRGWFPAPYDPNQLIVLFPCLRLKKGYHLGAYQFLDRNGNGCAKLFVIPDKQTLPKKPPQKALNDLTWDMDSSNNTPKWKSILRKVSHYFISLALPYYRSIPKWADGDIGKYIEGDESPLSYFQASILFRELYELGAIWHNVYWGHHKFVTSPSDLLYEDWLQEESKPIVWTWKEPEPKELCPVVWKDKDQRFNVTFYTIDKMCANLISYKDTFIKGYKFTISSKTIADYPGGYMV